MSTEFDKISWRKGASPRYRNTIRWFAVPHAHQVRLSPQPFDRISIRWNKSALDSALTSDILFLLPYQQRLSRVAEGTGPETPQQPGAIAKVLIPARGER